MVLRDYYCEVCGCVESDVMANSCETSKQLTCRRCDMITWHNACCNGGLGKRYRCNDFPTDPRRYRGQTSYSVEAYDNQDENNLIPSKRKGTDEVIHNTPRFNEENKKENMDKIYHKTDRERGYAPIICDLKTRTSTAL